MLSTDQKGYAEEAEIYEEQAFSETPFIEPRLLNVRRKLTRVGRIRRLALG
jgi:hypothetical protein